MNNAQRAIFGAGGFPRSVGASSKGEISQFYVHSESEWDDFFNKLQKEKNLYTSVARKRGDGRNVLHSVQFDFDSPMEDVVFDDSTSEVEKFKQMRNDVTILHKVLGSTWSDVQSLIKKTQDENIPAITVFSGMGFHVHLLYQERVEPVYEKRTISYWLIDECDLATHDIKIIPDTRRILRVPQSHRFAEINGKSTPLGVWVNPFTEEEILSMELKDVFEATKEPRDIEWQDRYEMSNRPVMRAKEEYDNFKDISNEETGGNIELSDTQRNEIDEIAEMIVRETVQMPCVRERILQRNPEHWVRFNFAIHMLNAWYSVDEIVEIAKGLNWIDFDASTTRKHVKQIKQSRYSEMSCETMYRRGLCVHSDEPEECPTYGWQSGECRFEGQ